MTQVRRKDGKFGGKAKEKKPVVSVFDKEGNVKVFRCYDELKSWMNEQEKLVSMITGIESNPDTEPASKGYVKCLLRKTRDHTHKQNVEFGWVGIGAMSGWVGLAMIYILTHTGGKPFPSEWWSAIVMFSVACTLVVLDSNDTSDTQTDYIHQNEPKQIQAYCCEKKKKDCE